MLIGVPTEVKNNEYRVAMTPAGGIELPATRRQTAGLRHVHALLEAYRVRAAQLAGR